MAINSSNDDATDANPNINGNYRDQDDDDDDDNNKSESSCDLKKAASARTHTPTTKEENIPGIWIGIDLGTTNSTAAFYSTSKSKAKLIRFRPPLAKLQSNDKHGRILPSAIKFQAKKGGKDGEAHIPMPIPTAIGADALKGKDDKHSNMKDDDERDQGTVALSSVKRIWGMNANQVKSELEQDPTFLEGCPFRTILKDDDNVMISIGNGGGDSDNDGSDDDDDDESSCISPLYVVETLLKTIKEEASHYFQNEKESPVGFVHCPEESPTPTPPPSSVPIKHCILTVPAHFSRNRRDQIVNVAKKVGFDGHVSTMVESTAAAMAYGLFVGTTKKRRILVFDMGGGTTDVTIAQMVPTTTLNENGDNSEPSFKVLGTLGERRLGGDDMDMRLADYVRGQISKSNNSMTTSKAQWDNQLRMSCRDGKEKICGDGKDELPAKSITIHAPSCSDGGGDQGQDSVEITQVEFDEIIAPLVQRAGSLVDRALEACNNITAESIDEVILVGGATRTPSIRHMLQNKFPKKELCYSIDPYAAVAQGAAIQSAIVSGLVPRHELRNALMLDALPHPIGVLLPSSESGRGVQDEMYVPILESGMELPAMNFASFRLADRKQKGVTIVAVEDVGDDLPLERLGEFTFLLHRLSDDSNIGKERMIDVGMTVETSGKFIVSIFDKNDPEHLKKKQRYQEWKRKQRENGEGSLADEPHQHQSHVYPLDSGVKDDSLGKEEILLIIGCMVVFILYVAIKMNFQEIEESSKIL